MSETEVQEVETNPIHDLIQHALNQDFNKANDTFGEIMSVRMSDLLDQEKIRIADQMYNGAENDEEEPEQLDLDLDDVDSESPEEPADAEGGDEEDAGESDDETEDESEEAEEDEDEDI